jgi:hypothetical protein
MEEADAAEVQVSVDKSGRKLPNWQTQTWRRAENKATVPRHIRNAKISIDEEEKQRRREVRAAKLNSAFGQMFTKYDTNSDGALDFAEAEAMFNDLHTSGDVIHYNKHDLKDKIMMEYDLDGNGRFEYSEVRAIITDLQTSTSLAKKLQGLVGLLFLLMLAILGVMFAVTLASAEAAKENHVTQGAMLSLDGAPVQTEKVSSYANLWNVPLIATDVLAKPWQLTCYVDMTDSPSVKAWSQASFTIVGAFTPAQYKMYLTTSDGSLLYIDHLSKTGTVTLGIDDSIYPLGETIPDALAERRKLSSEDFAAEHQRVLERATQYRLAHDGKYPVIMGYEQWREERHAFNLFVHGYDDPETGQRRLDSTNANHAIRRLQGRCEDMCDRSRASVVKKCGWGKCKGCAFCSTTADSAATLAMSSLDPAADSKITDAPVSAAAAPAANLPANCDAMCISSAKAWEKKCGWGKCKGCDECAPPEAPPAPAPAPLADDCDVQCVASSQPWTKKCGWGKCKGCGQCAPSPAPPFVAEPPLVESKIVTTMTASDASYSESYMNGKKGSLAQSFALAIGASSSQVLVEVAARRRLDEPRRQLAAVTLTFTVNAGLDEAAAAALLTSASAAFADADSATASLGIIVTTVVAPTIATTVVPFPPPPPPCESFCAKNSNDWTTKCAAGNPSSAWMGKCGGCPECYVSPPPPPSPPPGCSAGGTLYVDAIAGSDLHTGCMSSEPLKTITMCAKRVSPSGKCLVLPGNYSEPFDDDTPEILTTASDATIEGMPGAVVDGTIDLSGMAWEEVTTSTGSYYRTYSALSPKPWQLFIGGLPLTPARWPNAPAWSEEAWTRSTNWAMTYKDYSSCGTAVNVPANTAGLGGPCDGKSCGVDPPTTFGGSATSFEGCNLIINNEHWVTRRYKIKTHDTSFTDGGGATQAGDAFYYDPDTSGFDNQALCDKYSGSDDLVYYFIDGCEAALDSAGEFAYDSSGRLMIWSGPYGAPATWDLRGKTQTYALAFTESPGLTIKGLSFWATTVFAAYSKGATIRDNSFEYPSSSKRSLGADKEEFYPATAFGLKTEVSRPVWGQTKTYAWVPTTQMAGARSTDTSYQFINNTVYRSEGSGVFFSHTGHDLIENNLLTDVGYPFARSIEFYTKTGYQIIRRNTLNRDGAGGIGLIWGPDVVAELNKVTKSGLLITDSQGIGGGKLSQSDTIQLNWVHDTRGVGVRFDAGQDGVFGTNNNIVSNVLWSNGQGGIVGKATPGKYLRNTAFKNQVAASDWSAFGKKGDVVITSCFPDTCVSTEGGSAVTNIGSVTSGNFGQRDDAASAKTPTEHQKFPGTEEKNEGADWGGPGDGSTPSTFPEIAYADSLVDADNLDFRPLTSGDPNLIDAGVTLASTGVDTTTPTKHKTGMEPDIGAYDDGKTYYWIPGRQTPAASTPVPPDGATNVKADAPLMFLGGAKAGTAATKYEVYADGSVKCTLCAFTVTAGCDVTAASAGDPIPNMCTGSGFTSAAAAGWYVVTTFSDGSTETSATWTFSV